MTFQNISTNFIVNIFVANRKVDRQNIVTARVTKNKALKDEYTCQPKKSDQSEHCPLDPRDRIKGFFIFFNVSDVANFTEFLFCI